MESVTYRQALSDANFGADRAAGGQEPNAVHFDPDEAAAGANGGDACRSEAHGVVEHHLAAARVGADQVLAQRDGLQRRGLPSRATATRAGRPLSALPPAGRPG